MPYATPERRREARRERAEQLRTYQRDYYHRTKDRPGAKERRRDQRLKTRYGITSAEYDELLDAQNGRCAICGRETDYPLRVDHDHETGEVRGLLCQPCNLGLGYFQDSPELLRAAADYL